VIHILLFSLPLAFIDTYYYIQMYELPFHEFVSWCEGENSQYCYHMLFIKMYHWNLKQHEKPYFTFTNTYMSLLINSLQVIHYEDSKCSLYTFKKDCMVGITCKITIFVVMSLHQKDGYLTTSMTRFVVIYATSDYMTTKYYMYIIYNIHLCILYNIIIYNFILIFKYIFAYWFYKMIIHLI